VRTEVGSEVVKTNSVLVRHEVEAAAIKAVADRLTQWGFETKISFADNKVILATTAKPRTLRKARTATPSDFDNLLATLTASVMK
jgi:hypothetical protein